MTPGTPNFILHLVILIYISPPIFIKMGPKLPKLAIGGLSGRWVVGWLVKATGFMDLCTSKGISGQPS